MSEDKYSRMKMDCGEIGRALACSGDEEQAAVINALAKELRVVCRKDNFDSNMQVCYMAEKLDRHGKAFIRSLSGFVELREEADKP